MDGELILFYRTALVTHLWEHVNHCEGTEDLLINKGKKLSNYKDSAPDMT